MTRRKRTNKQVPAKGRLRDMCDALWSRAVRDDWNNSCAVCGARSTEAHHLIPRQHEATRYDLRNGIALCQHDHIWNPDTSPHQNAAAWILWLQNHYPIRHEWYMKMAESGDYRHFRGTKNAAHYIDVIRALGGFVEPEDFVRIVGKRFSEFLLTD